ncbi:methyltransferase domain-containing protein [Piscinibacter sp. XHJ-5]|uniref:class I SAM-dependent methyltransferase n=1 Tax=Piscinibacter sp. XHJ-5 TaxID=3037797 RepID=UPI002453107A|nr:methyltransferase domain-containing protein [Piscinibacter sp. XHJ-5]
MTAAQGRLAKLYYEILKIDVVRNYYCWMRYRFLKGRTRMAASQTSGVGAHTIDHNLMALDTRAGFGMANRMSLLLYPTAAALRNRRDARVLIVGPRTEDDIYWAKSLGMRNVRGLDLFSYSDMIDVGDMHKTEYPAAHFDAVILGWVVSYSSEPERLIAECKRIVKPGGYIGFGIESNPEHRRTGQYKPPRVNGLNSGKDIASLVGLPIMFIHDPELDVPTDNAVIFQAA